jgi:hypothetical protein
MTYSKEYKNSVIAEAMETLRRTSPEELIKRRQQPSDPVEDPVAKWRREAEEVQAQVDAENERLGMIKQLHQSTMKCQADIAMGLRSVGDLAKAIQGRLDEMSEEIIDLRTRLVRAETRFEDLKRSFDASARGGAPAGEICGSSAGVVDLKPRRA